MILRKILDWYHLHSATKCVRQNSILEGTGHLFAPGAYIVLRYGAKKGNVILKSNVWMLGGITVEDKGQVIMHEHAQIQPGSQILCYDRIEIGAYTAIGPNTTICDNNNHPVSPAMRRRMRVTPPGHELRSWKYSAHAPIIIGENCWIGANVRICKGVTIGDNSIVAANAVLTKSIPANCIAAGNPARIVKTDIDLQDQESKSSK